MDRQMDGQTNGWIDSYKKDGGGFIDGHTNGDKQMELWIKI